jgi:hypothetical protein
MFSLSIRKLLRRRSLLFAELEQARKQIAELQDRALWRVGGAAGLRYR